MEIISVLLPLGLPGPYDYRVPPELEVAVGDVVRVPLGSREMHGVVWAKAQNKVSPAKLKNILERKNVPPISTELRDFVDWVARYVMVPPGLVLRQMMRVPAAFEPDKPLTAYLVTGQSPPRMTPARARLLAVAEETIGLTRADLARQAGVGASVVNGLVTAGVLAPYQIAGHRLFPKPEPNTKGPDLSPEQNTAADALCAAVSAAKFGTHVLDGVTGSGKTEVYFEAIAAALKANKNVLILLPEISLTAQFLARFEARFACPPALWHSGLGAAERRRAWREIAENRVSVLVGARSALFLPWRNLGLVVVDEEHDGGYKQEEGVIYNARDMAVVRARLAACPVVLSSATPSLETFINVREGRYQAHRLTARHGGAQLPKMELVDMRATPPASGQWLVPPMIEGVRQAIERGEQALLFLNRRGYAPLTLCRACGHRYACPTCDAWLVEHRFRRELQCHHCGWTRPSSDICEQCGETGQLVACGPGIERITEEVSHLFPEARCAILSSDHMGGSSNKGKEGDMRDLIARLAKGAADIIIGTQIVAKGHHFPLLSFVGVVDADLGLGNGDLRAAERTYQVLSQVAGRSGRAATTGHAMLQSHMPDHPVLQALQAGARDAFLEREAQARQTAAMPPFGRLAAIIVSAKSAAEGQAFTRILVQHIPSHKGIRVLGPAPAPIARLRDRYRFRFLVKGESRAPLQGFIGQWLDKGLAKGQAKGWAKGQAKSQGSVRVSIDIDPYSFM